MDKEMIPTNDELRSFIETIAEFLKKFVEAISAVLDGLKIKYAGYKSAFAEEETVL